MLLRCSTHRPTLSWPPGRVSRVPGSWWQAPTWRLRSWRANSRPYFCLSPPPGPPPTTRHVLGKLLEGGAPPTTTLPQRRPHPLRARAATHPRVWLPSRSPDCTPAPAPSCSSLNLSAFSSPAQPMNPCPRVVSPLAKSVLLSLPESPPFPSQGGTD